MDGGDYQHGREHSDLEGRLARLLEEVRAHVDGGQHEHEHQLTVAEVEEVVEAAAEALAAVVQEAPAEVQAEVAEAAEAAEEACEAIVEAAESTDAGEEPPDRVHPLYRKL